MCTLTFQQPIYQTERFHNTTQESMFNPHWSHRSSCKKVWSQWYFQSLYFTYWLLSSYSWRIIYFFFKYILLGDYETNEVWTLQSGGEPCYSIMLKFSSQEKRKYWWCSSLLSHLESLKPGGTLEPNYHALFKELYDVMTYVFIRLKCPLLVDKHVRANKHIYFESWRMSSSQMAVACLQIMKDRFSPPATKLFCLWIKLTLFCLWIKLTLQPD